MADEQWHSVGKLSNIKARKKIGTTVAGVPVGVFFINGEVYALHDICIHEERNLSKGALLFGKVICPGHQWKFDPETGEPADQDGCQPTFAVKVEDDEVFVDVTRPRDA